MNTDLLPYLLKASVYFYRTYAILIKDKSLSEIRLNKNDIVGREDAAGLSLKCSNN